ncbi:TPA: hypothetical protein TY296_000671 [Streptococcus suis]|nr:hypothetical protein [Streptococcus suis]
MKVKNIISMLLISAFILPYTVLYADNDVDQLEEPSSSQEANLSIPSEADAVILETDDKVVYQINDGVHLESDNTETPELVAPIIVESEVLTESTNSISGVTTVTADLSRAEVVSEGSLEINLEELVMGPKVYAKNNTTTGSQFDSSLAVKLTTTVYWTEYDNGDALVTRVTGGYTNSDRTIKVISSSVKIGCSGNTRSQVKELSLGTATNWSKSNGVEFNFSRVSHKYAVGSVGGATYTVNLSRGSSSKWSVTYQNLAWQKAMMLIK